MINKPEFKKISTESTFMVRIMNRFDNMKKLQILENKMISSNSKTTHIPLVQLDNYLINATRFIFKYIRALNTLGWRFLQLFLWIYNMDFKVVSSQII